MSTPGRWEPQQIQAVRGGKDTRSEKDESQLRFPQAQAPSMVNHFIPQTERLLHELTASVGTCLALDGGGQRLVVALAHSAQHWSVREGT